MRTILPLLTIGLALSGWPAKADLPADAKATVTTAFQGIKALAAKTREQGTMPRWSQPAEREALAKIWNSAAILGTPPYRANDVPVLLDIIPMESAVLRSYILFTPKAGSPPNFLANSKIYEDEIARGSAFMIRINSVELPAVTDFLVHLEPSQVTEVRLQGMRQMRKGVLQEVTGATSIIRDGRLKPENQAAIVDALTDSADAISAALPPADRDAMIKNVEPVMPLLTADEKTRMQGFIKTMQRADCTALCAMK